MGRWVKISIEDVASYQAGALVKALESKAKYSETQENPLEAAIERITARIRSDVKSGGYAVDKAQDKIPGELSGEAVALIVEFAKPRLMQKLTADEVNLANAARVRLDKIAEGKIRKPGTGCVTMINDHLYEGRFSPRVNGKRIAKNIYATTREECEEKLKVLIAEMKKEIAEIKAGEKAIKA